MAYPKTQNPFSDSYQDSPDTALLERIENGDRKALEQLIDRHQPFIYNVALKLLLSPLDAEDLTQEVLIKVITKLGQFEGKSQFRTWLYRITFNHFLQRKQNPLENAISSFQAYGEELDRISDKKMNAEAQWEMRDTIKEAQLGCMGGMLLCLNREQRLVYVLGEIFGVPSGLGAAFLNLTPANFRKKLERARRDLYQFMQRKCGLVNKQNPCRCHRKTRGFIKAGWVDPDTLKFTRNHLENIQDNLGIKHDKMDDLIQASYRDLFRQAPFHEQQQGMEIIQTLLLDPEIRTLFRLDAS